MRLQSYELQKFSSNRIRKRKKEKEKGILGKPNLKLGEDKGGPASIFTQDKFDYLNNSE